MKSAWKTLVSVMIAGGLMCGMGCEKKTELPNEKPEATTPVVEADGEEVVEGSEALVTVTAAGAKIDPPVAVSQIPAGAYFCDMGTVHYARMEKGDGKCPECGMMLTQQVAEGAPGTAVAAKTECSCATGEKCEACEKAGEACTCGTDTPCEHCKSCDGKTECGCATGEKCEACEKAGEACTCGTDTPCEHCESCEGKKDGHACNHAPGEACDCGKKDGHGAAAGHDHGAAGHKH